MRVLGWKMGSDPRAEPLWDGQPQHSPMFPYFRLLLFTDNKEKVLFLASVFEHCNWSGLHILRIRKVY